MPCACLVPNVVEIASILKIQVESENAKTIG